MRHGESLRLGIQASAGICRRGDFPLIVSDYTDEHGESDR